MSKTATERVHKKKNREKAIFKRVDGIKITIKSTVMVLLDSPKLS